MIFFITSWFPSRVHPTNGNFVGRHARLLARRHRVVVVAIEADEGLALGALEVTRRSEDGYEVVQAYVGYGARAPGAVKAALRLRGYLLAMRTARRAFGRPELLHGHVLLDGGMVAAIWAKLWSCPLVLTEHSSAYHKPAALTGFRGLLGRYACRKAKKIMPVSDHLGRSMRELNGLHGDYQTVSNVVDERLYSFAPPPSGPTFRLLHVSNFDDGPKNITGLLRAFAALKQQPGAPVSLLIAGDGDLGELQRMIDETGHPGVTCSGPHTEAEIAKLMRECHAFALFSNYENQPVVLLEAQMSGRPCIATPVGGVPDIVIPGETGLLVPVGDEAALGTAILQMQQDYTSFDLNEIRSRATKIYSEGAVEKALTEVYSYATDA